MIPVHVPANAAIHTVGGTRTIDQDHPLSWESCPVCDETLYGEPITLVLVGIAPEDRKESGWTTGGAVGVHARCAGIGA